MTVGGGVIHAQNNGASCVLPPTGSTHRHVSSTLDTKPPEDKSHLQAIFCPPQRFTQSLAFGRCSMNILQYKLLFLEVPTGEVHMEEYVHAPTQDCHPKSSEKRSTPRGTTDLIPTSWLTTHKPHTPGRTTQTPAPFEHSGKQNTMSAQHPDKSQWARSLWMKSRQLARTSDLGSIGCTCPT